MDALKSCKQYGGPITAKYVQKLKLFTENEIIVEAVFLKRIAPTNIRLKHKLRSNFVKFTSRHRSLLIKHRVEGN